jgi:molybdopterin-containing oxidoreductase family iron-sulfur binding subunit
VAEKCTLCKERTDRGQEPMCVACCPTDARVFGDLDDPNSEVSMLVRQQDAYVLLEDKGTRPQVRYFD